MPSKKLISGLKFLIPTMTICQIITIGSMSAYSAGLTFRDSSLRVLEETPERNTGLDKIYVCYNTSGVKMVYEMPNVHTVKIYKFGNRGGAFAEEVAGLERGDGEVVLNNVEGDCGYIIENGDSREYYWVVNYLPYRFSVSSISTSAEQDCDATLLDVEGSGAPIHYYTINGQQKVLDRQIRIAYDTQVWNESGKQFETEEIVKLYESLSAQMRVTPPAYCSTSFHISGDKFLEQWNWLAEAESIVAEPCAVSAKTEAIQEDNSVGYTDDGGGDEGSEGAEGAEPGEGGEGNDGEGSSNTPAPGSNQIKGDDSGLGGSAPAEIEFLAYTTQGVIHHEWQMSTDPEFNEIQYRFNEQNLNYTFNDEGTFYLRYIGSNFDGSCEVVGDTYTVSIGSSELLCPNAFSPDGDGVNDEWKVSYRSIIEFECWIFDRYGAQLAHFKDINSGWDGKRGGKMAGPGVYYYVIRALGADGKKYKLSGDINILRHRTGQSSVSSAATE